MKTLSLFTLIIALVSLSFISPETKGEDDGIVFESMTFDEALKQAKATNKLIFMDAYAVWCGPCKWLDANTFRDKEVGEVFNANFINLKMDMEKGEGPTLAQRYKVTAYPTLFFINGDGEVVYKILGALKAKELLKKVEEVI